MTKADLSKVVAQKTGMTKKNAEIAVAAVFDGIVEALCEGEKVQLVGFGTFEVKERGPREMNNPRTGEKIMTPATKYPAFKSGKTLKEKIAK